MNFFSSGGKADGGKAEDRTAQALSDLFGAPLIRPASIVASGYRTKSAAAQSI
jgi:hypothetical protein